MDEITLEHSSIDGYYTDKAEDKGVDPDEVIEIGNTVKEEIAEIGDDLSWIHNSDAINAVAIREHGIDTAKYGGYSGNGTVAMPSEAHAVIWLEEVLGQISDGAWENYWVDRQTPGLPDEWKEYFSMDVVVDEDLDTPELRDGASVPVQLEYYDKLTRYDGHQERMVFMVRASGVDEDFDMDDLEEVLKDFEQM